MTNVIPISEGLKACPYCGTKPACPDFTCPRIKFIWHSEQDDEWEIEFHESWRPPSEPA